MSLLKIVLKNRGVQRLSVLGLFFVFFVVQSRARKKLATIVRQKPATVKSAIDSFPWIFE